MAHAMLEAAYYMLKRQEAYRELGATYYDERRKSQVVQQTVRRLEALGYDVTIKPVA